MVFVLVRLCYYTYLEATEKNYKSILKLIEELIKQVDEFFQKTDLILEFPVVTFWRQLVPTFLSLSNWLIFWFMIKIILLQHHLIDNQKPTNTHKTHTMKLQNFVHQTKATERDSEKRITIITYEERWEGILTARRHAPLLRLKKKNHIHGSIDR